MMFFRRVRHAAYELLRRRMIRETEASLAYALECPQRFPPIPTIEVGTGEFDRRFAQRYWEVRLGLQAHDASTNGRAHRPKGFDCDGRFVPY